MPGIAFLSGGEDHERLYVALVEAETGEELGRLTGRNTNTFSKFEIDCSAYKGKEAFIRIVDEATGPWGHINFGGIYEDPLSPYRD